VDDNKPYRTGAGVSPEYLEAPKKYISETAPRLTIFPRTSIR